MSSIGTVGIDAMLVIQIDRVDAEPLQRRVAGAPHVLGLAVDAEKRAVFAADVAELRREHRPDSRRSRIARPTSCSFVNGP